MEPKKSLFHLSSIDLIPNLSIRIPTVGEILEDESNYYNLVSFLTATPFQYMVQLDDLGLDYSAVSEYELFRLFFPLYAQSDLSILFGDLDTSDFQVYPSKFDQTEVIYSPKNDIEINECVYQDLADLIRRINLFEKINAKPGNDSARNYLLEKERKKQKRNKARPYEPYLEKLVIALVNTSEFPYNYETCMDLSIYKLNQSFRQIQKKLAFDHTMIGVYAGTIDTSKLTDKSSLSWIS